MLFPPFLLFSSVSSGGLSILCNSTIHEKGEIHEGAFNLASALSTAFTAVQGDVTSVLAVAIPVAIGIAGILFVARKAMKWFKSMAN